MPLAGDILRRDRWQPARVALHAVEAHRSARDDDAHLGAWFRVSSAARVAPAAGVAHWPITRQVAAKRLYRRLRRRRGHHASGDPVTLFAMAAPMCLFYEAATLTGRFALRP